MSLLGIAEFWFLGYDLGPNYDFGSRWARNKREKSDLNELSFWAHEPLRNVKKKSQSLESLNYDIRARIYAQIKILVPDERETDAKKSDFNEFSLWAHEPLINGKKNMSLYGIAQFWFSG